MARHPGNFATVAVGLLFVAIGVYTWFHMGRFLDHARETEAVVIEVLQESATPKGRTHPVVRFTVDGKEVVVRSDEHHNVKPADTVRLVYDTRNPQQIEITTLERAQRRRLIVSGLTMAVGLGVCVMGLRHLLGKA
ncbi:MAG TPA: DUF3592 domain-containing protein [Burkholderiales bacterium]|nr:DUF3592 domain-containing protein [Burkholderiales bacterium]